jgi:D-lactate dehydrogenase (cytochrome)
MIVKSNQDEIQQYLSDQANLKGSCETVYIVDATEEISEIIMAANNQNIFISVCGNHTSLTGASLPVSGWVLSTENLNQIIEINSAEMYAIVQPGVILKELQEILAQKGLFFPPDPTEDSCFIGGMISTNASGARSFKYGATRESIEELEVILPTGQLINLKRGNPIQRNLFRLKISDDKFISFELPPSIKMINVKNAAGYYLKGDMDPIDLFIGSEGTLGVITKAKLKLKPLPKNYISLVIFFDDLSKSFTFLHKLRALSKSNSKTETGLQARAIEFFDRNSLILLKEKFSDIPENSVAAFWVEQETMDEESYNFLLNEWDSILTETGIDTQYVWFGVDQRDRSKIINMRHTLPLLINDIIKKNNVRKLGTDIAVPDHLFMNFYNDVIAETEKRDLKYVAFGHFGDSHLHLNILPSNEEEAKIGRELYSHLCTLAINLGGTFSAEHGVGKTKVNYLRLMVGDSSIQFMEKVKKIFDPKRIFGVGNLFNGVN